MRLTLLYSQFYLSVGFILFNIFIFVKRDMLSSFLALSSITGKVIKNFFIHLKKSQKGREGFKGFKLGFDVFSSESIHCILHSMKSWRRMYSTYVAAFRSLSHLAELVSMTMASGMLIDAAGTISPKYGFRVSRPFSTEFTRAIHYWACAAACGKLWRLVDTRGYRCSNDARGNASQVLPVQPTSLLSFRIVNDYYRGTGG